jgi:hypothetical protein
MLVDYPRAMLEQSATKARAVPIRAGHRARGDTNARASGGLYPSAPTLLWIDGVCEDSGDHHLIDTTSGRQPQRNCAKVTPASRPSTDRRRRPRTPRRTRRNAPDIPPDREQPALDRIAGKRRHDGQDHLAWSRSYTAAIEAAVTATILSARQPMPRQIRYSGAVDAWSSSSHALTIRYAPPDARSASHDGLSLSKRQALVGAPDTGRALWRHCGSPASAVAESESSPAL